MPIILDGKATSTLVKQQIAEQTGQLYARKGIRPGLAVILVGEDPASQVYVKNKKRDCEECGFYSESYDLPADTKEKELLDLIAALNQNPLIDGILCQLPLPGHMNEKNVIASILPAKDVDAFHYENVGRIMTGDYAFLPCTPAGVMELLKAYDIKAAGKECVVVGRSNIVGKPMAMLLLHAHGTVTICHSKTPDLAEVCRRADILVAAVGKAGLIKGDMIKEGAVVIDVGMNKVGEKLCGDVDFASVSPKASAITPVPGGVGPMTRAMLMQNTLTAALRNRGSMG